MKTKIVYVATFGSGNYYLEQTLLSACSVKMHSPHAETLLVTDDASAATLDGWHDTLYKYIDKVTTVCLPADMDDMKRSRHLKTSLRTIVSGDYLFVDSDTIVCRPLDDIDHVEGDVCAVADMHGTFFGQPNDYAFAQFRKAGCQVTEDFTYYNSGVMLVRDTPKAHRLYAEWHARWLETCERGMCIDQVALRMADRRCGNVISEMCGEWNCQLIGRFLAYFKCAYILHYFSHCHRDSAKTMFLFRNDGIYSRMRAGRCIPDDVAERLRQPHKAFASHYMVLADEKYDAYLRLKPLLALDGYPRRLSLVRAFARLLSLFSL